MGNVGGQYNKLNSTATVNNGSGFPTPYNQDLYSGKANDPSVLLGLGIGKRFELENEWVKAASLGVHYQYFFANTISGQITQFSLPQFQNYSYQWPVSSNVIFAQGKLNFKDYKAFSPYFSLGLGGVIHQNDGYTEHAYPEITPRISPNFSNNGGTQFAYLLGVGLDYPIGNQMTLSAGYQFSGLGRAKSGPGEGTWSGEYLDYGNYQSNAFLFSATYWFDMNFDFGWIK
jgi:opacity protein-like surface antigen